MKAKSNWSNLSLLNKLSHFRVILFTYMYFTFDLPNWKRNYFEENKKKPVSTWASFNKNICLYSFNFIFILPTLCTFLHHNNHIRKINKYSFNIKPWSSFRSVFHLIVCIHSNKTVFKRTNKQIIQYRSSITLWFSTWKCIFQLVYFFFFSFKWA